MKLKYFFSLVLAAVALLTACSVDNDPTYLDEIRVSKSYVTLPLKGGVENITVTASADWAFDEATIPAWVSVSPLSGNAGVTTVAISMDEGEFGQVETMQIHCGSKTLEINVQQGLPTPETATCADVIAGPDGKNFRVRGTCTAIANTTYGNWTLTDETGSIAIYGTLDKDGQTKNFLSLGIEVGDVITVEGPKTTYGSTIELVDVTVVKIEKSLLKIISESASVSRDGGDIEVTVAYKGSGVYFDIPDGSKSWISYTGVTYKPGIPNILVPNPSDTAVVKFHVAANEAESARNGAIDFTSYSLDGKNTISTTMSYIVSQKGGIVPVTAAEFLAASVGDDEYRLTGVVSEYYYYKEKVSGFYISDYSGKVLVYSPSGFTGTEAKVGDIVTVAGQRGAYKDTPQMTKCSLEKVNYTVTEVTIAEFLTKEDNNDVYYMVTGTVKDLLSSSGAENDYGNLHLTDGTNELYVYGCYPGYGATGDARKGFVKAAGIEVGDKLTMIGYKSTYKGLIELCGGIYFSHEKAE